MPRIGETRWQRFRQKWSNCLECRLCETRKTIVLCRGVIPCQVLFIGEAPGASEDVLGQPFVGPAGKLLDQQIEEASLNSQLELKICFTNLVCCIPKDGGRRVGEPDKDCIDACETRLKEFVHLCRPRLVVLVGDLAKKIISGQAHFSYDDEYFKLPWIDQDHDEFLEFCHITHPAAILRAEIVRKSLMDRKVVVTLENAFRTVFHG